MGTETTPCPNNTKYTNGINNDMVIVKIIIKFGNLLFLEIMI
jgi:hypothetical protein